VDDGVAAVGLDRAQRRLQRGGQVEVTRIAVLTDVHGNLPALEAALRAIQADGCDAIVHTGDAIGIGPYPAECLDLLLGTPTCALVMGNHDAWFAFGLPRPRPSWMSEGELAHQLWVHAQIDPTLRSVVAGWPDAIREEIEGVHATFLHYGLTGDGRGFASLGPHPEPADLDRLFERGVADVVCFGHDHAPCDATGRARYLNPGSLGCSHEPVARYLVLDLADGRCRVERKAVPYDQGPLFRAFTEREVPEREFILAAFFGAG
jgi:putative phosphoesterase